MGILAVAESVETTLARSERCPIFTRVRVDDEKSSNGQSQVAYTASKNFAQRFSVYVDTLGNVMEWCEVSLPRDFRCRWFWTIGFEKSVLDQTSHLRAATLYFIFHRTCEAPKRETLPNRGPSSVHGLRVARDAVRTVALAKVFPRNTGG